MKEIERKRANCGEIKSEKRGDRETLDARVIEREGEIDIVIENGKGEKSTL